MVIDILTYINQEYLITLTLNVMKGCKTNRSFLIFSLHCSTLDVIKNYSVEVVYAYLNIIK